MGVFGGKGYWMSAWRDRWNHRRYLRRAAQVAGVGGLCALATGATALVMSVGNARVDTAILVTEPYTADVERGPVFVDTPAPDEIVPARPSRRRPAGPRVTPSPSPVAPAAARVPDGAPVTGGAAVVPDQTDGGDPAGPGVTAMPPPGASAHPPTRTPTVVIPVLPTLTPGIVNPRPGTPEPGFSAVGTPDPSPAATRPSRPGHQSRPTATIRPLTPGTPASRPTASPSPNPTPAPTATTEPSGQPTLTPTPSQPPSPALPMPVASPQPSASPSAPPSPPTAGVPPVPAPSAARPSAKPGKPGILVPRRPAIDRPGPREHAIDRPSRREDAIDRPGPRERTRKPAIHERSSGEVHHRTRHGLCDAVHDGVSKDVRAKVTKLDRIRPQSRHSATPHQRGHSRR